jgi:hypothetical protein
MPDMLYKNLYKVLVVICVTYFSSLNIMAQNTGIGTFNPTNTLHVVSPNSNEDPLRIEFFQNWNSSTDTAVVVYNPVTGILRTVSVSEFIEFLGVNSLTDQDNDPGNELQNATEVSLSPHLDANRDGVQETNVQEAISVLSDYSPRGVFKSFADARAAGLQDGDSFISHPEGKMGCSGCFFTLQPGMN